MQGFRDFHDRYEKPLKAAHSTREKEPKGPDNNLCFAQKEFWVYAERMGMQGETKEILFHKQQKANAKTNEKKYV